MYGCSLDTKEIDSEINIAELFSSMRLASLLQMPHTFCSFRPQSGVRKLAPLYKYINGQWQCRSLPFGTRVMHGKHGSPSCLFRKYNNTWQLYLLVLYIGHTPQHCMCCCPSPGQPNGPRLGPDYRSHMVSRILLRCERIPGRWCRFRIRHIQGCRCSSHQNRKKAITNPSSY